MSVAEKLFGPETPATSSPASGGSGSKLKLDRKQQLIGAGVVVAVGAGLYARKHGAGVSGAASALTGSSSASQQAAAASSGGTGAYDSTASDVYDSVEPLLEQMQGLLAQTSNGGPTPQAPSPSMPGQIDQTAGETTAPTPNSTTPRAPKPGAPVHHKPAPKPGPKQPKNPGAKITQPKPAKPTKVKIGGKPAAPTKPTGPTRVLTPTHGGHAPAPKPAGSPKPTTKQVPVAPANKGLPWLSGITKTVTPKPAPKPAPKPVRSPKPGKPR